ncbi:MAG: hypothetical protein ACREJO_13025, partial [Phycisphaerales bacterium]
MPTDAETPATVPVPDAELAVLYCRGREVRCPFCRCSMRNASTPLCPECARTANIEQLAGARPEPSGRTAAGLIWSAGVVGWVVGLGVMLLGAGVASRFIHPLVYSRQIPWLVGLAAIVLCGAAWIGILIGLAKWLAVPIRTANPIAPTSPSRAARIAATFTAPRSLRRCVLMLALLSALTGLWHLWERTSNLVVMFTGGADTYWFGAWSLIDLATSVLVVLANALALIAFIARARRRLDPLADGVVVGWIIVGLALSYATW